eukprot:TRINITY_DN9760_c0_g1_i2.p1 TRINITY_DN9760_c0_g1~~TRINITY_DN9760_c0_g1_i2.p1  ORF type:complete len:271 (+),score=52.71 TRINITY_DN9760_c0_g1_i2:181-993(+)
MSSFTSSGSSTSEKVRVLVAGDSRVGKTALINLLCYSTLCTNSAATVGASIDIKIHETNGRQYFIEMIEMGGTSKYESTRAQIYPLLQINGLILVYDLTNKKSYNNLKKWLREILQGGFNWVQDQHSSYSASHRRPQCYLEAELVNGGQIVPILLIGNKLDLQLDSSSIISSPCITIDEIDVDSLQTNGTDPKCFSDDDTLNNEKLKMFFNKVIARKYSHDKMSPMLSGGSGVTTRHSSLLTTTPSYSSSAASSQFHIDIPTESWNSKYL